MKTIAGVLSSEALPSERASDRTAAKLSTKEHKSLELRRLEKMAADLRTGFVNLRALRPPPHGLHDRILAQAAKLRSVEAKLFSLKQYWLL